jgi:tRNA1(Val) A37 N6-methylase TrmN6
MALIFPRIAQNYIKNGYFPTDLPTLARIASALDVGGETVRIIDPCCGEGGAAMHLVEHLQQCGSEVASFGVDVDEERAWHAKTVLGTVAHADVHDVRIADRSMGLLFLNPPYGDLVADGAKTGDDKQGRERHEKLFCRRTFNLLQAGGVLVLVVPFYTLDAELSTLIARHFERVEVFMSGEQAFKQCVLFGVKRKPASPSTAVVNRLVAFGKGQDQLELPEIWDRESYIVPGLRVGVNSGGNTSDDFHFTVIRLDARQLDAELDQGLHKASLWPRFEQLMGMRTGVAKRPLRAMTDWHLALALAAGQISGIVQSEGGRRLLIKGRTHKAKDAQVTSETAADGTVSETRVLTDKFITVIRAIDLTPGPDLGKIVTIA